MTSIKSHPPKLGIGRGGPRSTLVAQDLRKLRETARGEWLALRRPSEQMSDVDRERRLAELREHIKFLSEKIRREEHGSD